MTKKVLPALAGCYLLFLEVALAQYNQRMYAPAVYSYSPLPYQQASYQPMYQPQMSYQPQPSYQPPSYQPEPPTYMPPAQPSYMPEPSYPSPPTYMPPAQPSYMPEPSYPSPPTYMPPAQPSYSPPAQPSYQPKPQKERIYVPVYVKKRKKKKKKKMKILSVQKGAFIPGGFQAFGKFKSLKGCQKACAQTPTCFAGDYNPWLKKCYFHGNITGCASMNVHPAIIHFKKVPCSVPFAPDGLITLGALNTRGILSKGIKNLAGCIKACRNLIPYEITIANIPFQTCFAVDYDFATHKCYLHSDNNNGRLCQITAAPGIAPKDRIANAAVVNIAFCPIA